MSPGVKNLFLILRMSGGEDAYHSLTKAWEEGNLKYSDLKGEVSEALLTFLAPVQDRYREIQDDKRKYRDQIKDSTYTIDRKSTRLNSSHVAISYAVFCLYQIK